MIFERERESQTHARFNIRSVWHLRMKRKGGTTKGHSPIDRVSLNPSREAEDERDAESVLSDPSLREPIEACWFCVLHNGSHLRTQRCDVPRFRLLVEASGMCSTDRQMNAALRQFSLHVTEDDDRLDLRGFVKCLLHIGCDRFGLPADKPAVMRKMIDTYLTPYVVRYRATNAHDGTGPDDTLLNIPEIDRLLYVHDAVFERLFLRYRDVDHHQTRELTLEQVKILDQFMEIEEMREFLKDFGFFPRLCSFVELSKAGQWASFGKLVVDPTKQGAGRVSNIEAAKKAAGDGGVVGVNVAASDGVADPQATAEHDTVNALHVPSLPQEYQTSEVLLDKARFMSCVLRLAQMIYAKPEHQKLLPSIVSRVEEFLAQVSPVYERMFNRSMDSDCDYSEKGVPLLNNVSPSSALQPDRGPLSGGIEIAVLGSNFCEKRGVFVRFGSTGDVVVRAKSITKKKILVDAPAMAPDDVEVDVDFQHGEYVMKICKTAKVIVECSNNRWQYSDTDPAQCFTFRGAPRYWTFGEELSAQLMKLFGAVCALTEINGVPVAGGGSSNKLMNRERWRELKRMTGMSEAVTSRSPRRGGPEAAQGADSTSGAAEEDKDVFFLELAEYHDADHDLSLPFKAFLRAVTRTLYEMHGEEMWRTCVDEIAATQLGVQRRVVQPGPIMEQNELVLARRAIAMVERRSMLELDVFMGPVLCGVLRSRPGDVTSSYSGLPTVHVRGHSFLSYDQVEINTETCILRHLQMSYSIPHFILRLKKDGFDFASRHPRQKTRKPAGRCWALFLESAPDKQIGAVWDYEGNYSCLEWQPAEKELFHPQITMTLYEEERSTQFVACYLLFQKSSNVQHLRAQLEWKGFTLKTKLYRVP